MQAVNWDASPHVHCMSIDFICGQIVAYRDIDAYGEMWGGFTFALLLPEHRTGPLERPAIYPLNYESAPRWLSETFAARRSE